MAEEKQRVLVVGLGKTGLSCARHLARQGVEVAVADSRADPPGLTALRDELPDVGLFLNGFDPQVFASADQLVVSPGVSPKEPVVAAALQRGIPVYGDIDLFARAARAPIVAVTGSNGKSTVTSMVAAMGREDGRNIRVGGNLGTPVLDLLGAQEPDCYVIELSSFQLEYTYELDAAASVVLNVSPDHMDRYDSMDEYAAAKQRIYRGSGVMIINADDPRSLAMADAARQCRLFTAHEPGVDQYGCAQHKGERWLMYGAEPLLPSSALRLPGEHNLSNALAALALGEVVGFRRESMLAALRQFNGLAHRTQWVAEANGVVWYNDSKGTNVGATVAAIGAMPGPIVLIAGGDAKDADFADLRTAVQGKARAVILIGRDAPRLAEALRDVTEIAFAKDMEEAVAMSHERAQAGDCVLLSPACASFDMYSGYEERGKVFRAAVLELLG